MDKARRDGRAAWQQTCVSLRSPALDASNRGIAGVTDSPIAPTLAPPAPVTAETSIEAFVSVPPGVPIPVPPVPPPVGAPGKAAPVAPETTPLRHSRWANHPYRRRRLLRCDHGRRRRRWRYRRLHRRPDNPCHRCRQRLPHPRRRNPTRRQSNRRGILTRRAESYSAQVHKIRGVRRLIRGKLPNEI